jgi:hypothetical protein
VEPSSLVFVAIIGVWAAYLVPHWLRRRDDLAQSRTGDRFSGGLRVLNRRRRPTNSSHRSGDAVLTSPRVVIDADGEFLYIPADRALAARANRAVTEPAVGEPAVSEPAASGPAVAGPAVRQPAAFEPAAEAAATPGLTPGEASGQASAHRPARPHDLEVAIAGARVAARRRALIMTLLIAASVSSWGLSTVPSISTWVVVPATTLLVLHMLASRAAGLRSRETLMLLAAQLHSAELAQARPQHQVVTTARPADLVAEVAAKPLPDRIARRAAAVGAETWEPVPVPPPTYTLKPAVHRPEPAPLDLPAAHAPAHSQAAHSPAGQVDVPAAAVSRGALPRRAADIERILALESDLDDLFQHRAG